MPADIDYAGLQTMIADTRDALQGNGTVFQIGEVKAPFTAEGFLMSLSIPNFHFHATTAYDLLRLKGVKLGKRDDLGKRRMKS